MTSPRRYIPWPGRPIIQARGLLESARHPAAPPRPKDQPTVRIERLSVKNWRNFKSAEIDIGRRLFLVGPNASGKSNLLDALRFLHDVAERGLRHAVESRGGIARVRCLFARSFNSGWVGLGITLQDSENVKWTYELHFTGEEQDKHRPAVTMETVTKDGELIIKRPDKTDENDPTLLTQTALEQVSSNQKFRSVAEILDRIRYMHLVPQIIKHYEPGQDGIEDPFGSRFLTEIAQTKTDTRDSRLDKITQSLRLAVPQITDISFSRDEVGKPHLLAGYAHWRPDPARQDESEFSDGTLRLIGLLWLLQEAASSDLIVLLEEPELSLHAAIVRQLPTILYQMTRYCSSQVILSTHSGEMLQDPGLGIDEVVILQPGYEGTTVTSVADLVDIEVFRTADMNIDEIVEPLTEPLEVWQLSRLSQ